MPRMRGDCNERAAAAIRRCLQAVLLLQCLGVAGRYYLSAAEKESDVYGYLYFDRHWSEATAQWIDDIGALACLGCAVAVCASGFLTGYAASVGRAGRFIEGLAAFGAFVWLAALSLTHMVRGASYAELTLGEHAVRFAIPLALLWLYVGGLEGCRRLLMVATAATFAVHGYKAVDGYGSFVDLILLSDANWTGFEFSENAARDALLVIGVLDILLAVLVVVTRWRWVAGYMAFWGAVAAGSRLTAFGSGAWPEFFIRAANWGAPLAVLFILRQSSPPAELSAKRNEQG